MKRFVSAFALCFALLVVLSLFLFPPVRAAKENPILTLLNMPAPAPPNPSAKSFRIRDQHFYNKSNPPKDDAPLDELLDYWTMQSNSEQKLHYSPEPSAAVRERIMRELARDPKILPNVLNLFKRDLKGIDLIKEIFDREALDGVFEKEERRTIKHWLTYNSPYFSDDLARRAANVGDTDEYVTGQDELLALARVDFERARPIIDRLHGDPSLRTSRVLATWAQYRHALDSASEIDAERYREELKKMVADRNALPGMRDLALDALSSEKEWPGRDEWYFSQMADETLAELRVAGSVHSGLTTLIQVSPDDKYTAKMIELSRSGDPVLRSAAVRNLITRLPTGGPDIVEALLPWLEDPRWAADTNGSRMTLLYKLSEYEIPESVPGLIKVLDERATRVVSSNSNVNTAANAVANISRLTSNSNSSSNSNRSRSVPEKTEEYYPNRFSAISALKKQKDVRAVNDLRRVLNENEGYERGITVGAIFASGGFTVAEQLRALETAARGVQGQMDAEMAENGGVNAFNAAIDVPMPEPVRKGPMTPEELNSLLAEQLSQATEIGDELAKAAVERIAAMDENDPTMAAAMRRLLLKWQNGPINVLLLSDVKRGRADADTMVRLLSQRKELRENHLTGVSDLRSGKPSAVGLAACMFEDKNEYDAVMAGREVDSKIALLACARLLRAPLIVRNVAEHLRSQNPLLALAAERYLESEDSPEARGVVLARHPGQARILGATSAFFVEGKSEVTSDHLYALYQSLGNDALYNGWYGSGNDGDLEAIEKRLRDEVKKDGDLLGVYSYDRNYIRIYRDRAMYSWDDDDSRFRERPLTQYEFDQIKAYITSSRADDLPPFLSCGGEYCEAKELLMLGRNGGRRVYMNGDPAEFFVGLDKYFAVLKRAPATLKYQTSRETPGLEIVIASDELHAETVWKNGADLRVAASRTDIRKKVEADIEKIGGDDNTIDVPDYEATEAKKTEVRNKRRYEGFSWYKVVNGTVQGVAGQPEGVEYLPFMDGLGVPPGDEQWKARAVGFELRATAEGLFKVVRGRVTKIRSGDYTSPLVTPGGRWAIVTKTDPNTGKVLFRVDLVTNREYPLVTDGYGEWFASAYIPMLNKVLVARDDSYGYDEHHHGGYTYIPEDAVPADADPEGLKLVDPATGIVTSPPGEFRPLDQQTFRSLQITGKPNEFWAAMPSSETNMTSVGVYNAKTFSFRLVRTVPKVKFNSMSMWVDEAEAMIYFVYRGHLLRLPLDG